MTTLNLSLFPRFLVNPVFAARREGDVANKHKYVLFTLLLLIYGFVRMLVSVMLPYDTQPTLTVPMSLPVFFLFLRAVAEMLLITVSLFLSTRILKLGTSFVNTCYAMAWGWIYPLLLACGLILMFGLLVIKQGIQIHFIGLLTGTFLFIAVLFQFWIFFRVLKVVTRSSYAQLFVSAVLSVVLYSMVGYLFSVLNSMTFS